LRYGVAAELVLNLHDPAWQLAREWENSRPAGLIGLADSVDAVKGLAPMFVAGLSRGCCPAFWTHVALQEVRIRAAVAAAVEQASDGLSA
jgi:hypothetical protein